MEECIDVGPTRQTAVYMCPGVALVGARIDATMECAREERAVAGAEYERRQHVVPGQSSAALAPVVAVVGGDVEATRRRGIHNTRRMGIGKQRVRLGGRWETFTADWSADSIGARAVDHAVVGAGIEYLRL